MVPADAERALAVDGVAAEREFDIEPPAQQQVVDRQGEVKFLVAGAAGILAANGACAGVGEIVVGDDLDVQQAGEDRRDGLGERFQRLRLQGLPAQLPDVLAGHDAQHGLDRSILLFEPGPLDFLVAFVEGAQLGIDLAGKEMGQERDAVFRGSGIQGKPVDLLAENIALPENEAHIGNVDVP
jgi:hypothetical protein